MAGEIVAFEHRGVSTEGVPFGRAVRSCPEMCGRLRCCREADHDGLD